MRNTEVRRSAEFKGCLLDVAMILFLIGIGFGVGFLIYGF